MKLREIWQNLVKILICPNLIILDWSDYWVFARNAIYRSRCLHKKISKKYWKSKKLWTSTSPSIILFFRGFWKSIFHKNHLEMVLNVCLLTFGPKTRKSQIWKSSKKNKKKHFFKNLIFFGHMKIHQDIVNQIPGPGYNRKFKKVRAQIFFFTFFLKFPVSVTFWWDSLYIWYNARAKPRNFRNYRKSFNLKSRYLRDYLDFFKNFGCFGKLMDSTF